MRVRSSRNPNLHSYCRKFAIFKKRWAFRQAHLQLTRWKCTKWSVFGVNKKIEEKCSATNKKSNDIYECWKLPSVHTIALHCTVILFRALHKLQTQIHSLKICALECVCVFVYAVFLGIALKSFASKQKWANVKKTIQRNKKTSAQALYTCAHSKRAHMPTKLDEKKKMKMENKGQMGEARESEKKSFQLMELQFHSGAAHVRLFARFKHISQKFWPQNKIMYASVRVSWYFSLSFFFSRFLFKFFCPHSTFSSHRRVINESCTRKNRIQCNVSIYFCAIGSAPFFSLSRI